MEKPDIKTAIPKRRYKIGNFGIVVLADIESGDGREYRFICAVVREGDAEPGMYVTAERADAKTADGSHAMRVIMRDGAQTIGHADRWGSLDGFVDDAVDAIVKILGLADEEPYRMM